MSGTPASVPSPHGADLLGVAESSADPVQLKPTTLEAMLDRLAGKGLVEADGDETVRRRTRRCSPDPVVERLSAGRAVTRSRCGGTAAGSPVAPPS